MRRIIWFLVHGSILSVAFVGLTAGEDVQVIQSRRSTLSIYSYGGAAPSRVLPEFRDAAGGYWRNAGALTDVVTIPPLSVTVPGVKSAASATPAPNNSFGTKTSAPDSAPSLAESDPARLPVSRIVTIGWNPSPESSVAGYRVYIGDSSGYYTDQTAVGNQTTAALEIGQSTLYVAVSAYTFEGLESALSDELIISTDKLQGAGASGGLEVFSRGTQ